MDAGSNRVSSQQTDFSIRLLLLADAFAFGDFVPSLFIGMNYYENVSPSGVKQAYVPVIGADIANF